MAASAPNQARLGTGASNLRRNGQAGRRVARMLQDRAKHAIIDSLGGVAEYRGVCCRCRPPHAVVGADVWSSHVLLHNANASHWLQRQLLGPHVLAINHCRDRRNMHHSENERWACKPDCCCEKRLSLLGCCCTFRSSVLLPNSLGVSRWAAP